jgi:nucleoside 2-deoxyribosyltransferase
MKFYIASRFSHCERVRDLAGKLKAAGWIQTYDWTISHVAEETLDMFRDIAQTEVNAVRDADVVIILAPGGKGTHVELGMAIALGKKIYLCHADDTYFLSKENTTTFYWLPSVNQLFGTTEEIARAILLDNQA